MSHWAELDDNNVVIRVLVCDNNDPNGDEGYQWLVDTFGGRWVKTSYNNNIRVRYAGLGYSYNEQIDAFVPPKPHNSWVFDDAVANWVAPIPCPSDNKRYIWNEELTRWDEFVNARSDNHHLQNP
jgi:hypothetical protein